MLSGAVTNRYTQGLYDVAVAHGIVAKVEQGLLDIASVVQQFPELKMLIEHPLIDLKSKLTACERIFGDQVEPTVYRFLRVLFARNRAAYVEAVATRFHEMAEAAEGRVSVLIESAEPVPSAVQAQLEQKLAVVLTKQVQADVQVKPDLLAGYRIRLGNRVLDATIRGAISQFSAQLLAAGASKEGTR